MSIEVDAVYEDGVLKLDRPLPLPEHQRVKITVQERTSIVRANYGIIGWQGNPEVVERIALDPEHGIADSP